MAANEIGAAKLAFKRKMLRITDVYDMPLQLKDVAKLNQVVGRIQAGQFDANDVDNLLMKLRAYAGEKTVFLEIAHFVAHSDARDRGLAQESITAFVDSIQYFQEYISEKRPLSIQKPKMVLRLQRAARASAVLK